MACMMSKLFFQLLPINNTMMYRFLLTVIVSVLLVSCSSQLPSGPDYVLVIHGGAGTILRENMTPEKEERYVQKLSEALESGEKILRSGGSSIDAVAAAVKIMEDSVANAVYREKLGGIGRAMAKGEGIAESFRKAAIFPPFVVRMIGIGEVSGTLSDQLAYIAEEYRHKLTTLVSTMGKMLEPVVLIVAGILFAIIIGGLFLPIYDLVANIAAA